MPNKIAVTATLVVLGIAGPSIWRRDEIDGGELDPALTRRAPALQHRLELHEQHCGCDQPATHRGCDQPATHREQPPAPGVSRIDGHLFLLVDEPQLIVGVDRVRVFVPDREPGETAFVLTRG